MSTGLPGNQNACEDTKDNIFLLSQAEAINGTYGLASNASRIKQVTDYSKKTWAQWQYATNNGFWWLRSPHYVYNYAAFAVSDYGDIVDNNVNLTGFGVAPALKIALRTPGKYMLSLDRDSSVAGTVSGGGNKTAGNSVTITAKTNPGYIFDGWYVGETRVRKDASWTFDMPSAHTKYEARWVIYQRIDGNGDPSETGNFILFGEYPQTYVENPQLSGTTGTMGELEYTLGLDGVTRYVEVNGLYFRVDPIKWRILNINSLGADGDVAFILCESIIANKRYDDDANYYNVSEIRAWLNDQFYTTAFSTLQKQLIELTWVDNSVGSTGYSENQFACDDTEDNIFLLSYVEATSAAYGLDTDASRIKQVTDYSKKTGAWSGEYSSNGMWWLRSPNYDYDDVVRLVIYSGHIYGNGVYDSRLGVVPALRIALRKADKYMLSLHKNSSTAGSVSGGGNYDANERVTIEATTTPGGGYLFDGWYNEEGVRVSEEANWEFDMPASHTKYEARWKTLLTVNKNIDVAGGISIWVEGEGTGRGYVGPEYINIDEAVILQVTTQVGYQFDGWYRDGIKVTFQTFYDFAMPGKPTVFEAKWDVLLTVNNALAEAGTVSGGGFKTYNVNTTVTATPKSGYTFAGWYENNTLIEGAEENYTFLMPDTPRTLEARWVAYQRIDGDGNPLKTGNFILFGEWPQTEETNLENVSGETVSAGAGSEFDSYYLGTDGVTRYVKVGSKYFKVEPIKWRILNYNRLAEDNNKALILCESIIANKAYDIDIDGPEGPDTLSNKYDASQIRAWLNNQFYVSAFNGLRKELIEKIWVDNSDISTGEPNNPNACENTEDNIFLLSYEEATSQTYGLNSPDSRIKQVTDYSKEIGVDYDPGSGNGIWWLRSPYYHSSYSARGVDYVGYVYSNRDVSLASSGVVPALVINLT